MISEQGRQRGTRYDRERAGVEQSADRERCSW